MCHSQCAILSSYVKLPEGKTISPNYNGQHVENSRVQFVHVISYCWGSAAKLKTGTYTPVTEDGSCPTWHHSKWAQVIPAMDVETMPCSMQRPPHTVAITDDISGNIIINYIRPTLANWHNIYIYIYIYRYIYIYIIYPWMLIIPGFPHGWSREHLTRLHETHGKLCLSDSVGTLLATPATEDGSEVKPQKGP